MNKKWPIFTGILILSIGIILKKTTNQDLVAISCIAVGILLKVYYIAKKAVEGTYRIGVEMGAFVAGLILFFSGLYLKRTDSEFNYLIIEEVFYSHSDFGQDTYNVSGKFSGSFGDPFGIPEVIKVTNGEFTLPIRYKVEI